MDHVAIRATAVAERFAIRMQILQFAGSMGYSANAVCLPFFACIPMPPYFAHRIGSSNKLKIHLPRASHTCRMALLGRILVRQFTSKIKK